MSTALFIVVNHANPDFDVWVNGKALAKAEPQLAEIAARSGIRSLMEFYGADDSEMAAEFDVPDMAQFTTRWFEAEDGLAAVGALLSYLDRNPGAVENSAAVVADLREFERVLTEAAQHRLKWHLAVDY